ncbi:MAG: metallophosphoesterase [Clostridia bacterium]|nr:metallophosphoesterase [Clostridia bacterium]
MEKIRHLFAVLCVGLALIMLVTGISPITKTKQQTLEKALEDEIDGEFTPVFRFAVASDVHINAGDDTTAKRLAKLFQTAYTYSDAQTGYRCLDAVVLVGDNCDSGSEAEYKILNAVIAENKRAETQMITVMGNHEFAQTGHEGYVRNMNEALDKHVVVKGFHFIGLSPDPSDTWHTPTQINWMSKQLREAAKDDPNKPIFTMQHGHIWNTVYVSRSWFTQMFLPLHMVYAQYPQVINFSGHSHGPINNPLDIWQNSYTTVGTGTLNYFEMERDIGDETVPAGARNAAQYFIVEVDAANRVRLQPYNILTEDFMKTPATTDDPEKQLVYLVHSPADASNYVYTSARRKTASTPYFEAGDAVTVTGATADSVTLSFPQAEDDICVYGYRITLKDAKHPLKKIVKEIYSEYYFEPIPETLSCTVTGLAAGTTYSVSVTPLNVWLTEGEPITCSVSTANN